MVSGILSSDFLFNFFFFQSISDDRVWIVAFGKKIAHFVGFGREIGVVTAKSTKPEKLRVRN